MFSLSCCWFWFVTTAVGSVTICFRRSYLGAMGARIIGTKYAHEAKSMLSSFSLSVVDPGCNVCGSVCDRPVYVLGGFSHLELMEGRGGERRGGGGESGSVELQ